MVLGGAGDCGSTGGAKWQISLADLDLPFINYTSIRLDDQNRAHSALWTNRRILKGVSDIVTLGEAQAAQFRELVNRRRSSGFFGFFRRRDKSRAQQGGGIEFSRIDAGGTWSRSSDSISSESEGRLTDLLKALPLGRPKAGKYVWTKFLSGVGRTDINLRDDCDTAIKRAVSQSLQSVRIVAPISQGYEHYFEGEYSARFEFGARLTNGYAGYGVIQA